ncbi:MAG: DUF6089 family protein [Saprospiraceae bacterium]|nr:DUF6089 family protein [Saprospiraceae bacterium]MCF8248857.1 DUF6089 family protein [Saprospiraceae bacterium]MCF8279582.1 DUF6089 family protein [Bacteroidales bacterium]MCF8310142.1 DUF6089 family protein [Saprospiraceae bacterium]MCF8439042.1 DUF6089 family protein [Saprospiraceae bacterium]
MHKLTICLYFLAFGKLLSAQSPLEAGLFGGLVVYQGDLSENDIFEINEFNPAFGGLLRYHLNEKWKVRGHVIYGKISGTDKNAKDPGLNSRGWSYESFLVELTFVGEYHPWGKLRANNGGLFKPQISPYLGAGVGFINFNPKVNVEHPQDAVLFPETQRTTTAMSIPLVIGFRYDFSERYIATLEGGWRVTFNDYLDGVSKNGNPKKNDPFIFVGLSLTYYFGYDTSYHF